VRAVGVRAALLSDLTLEGTDGVAGVYDVVVAAVEHVAARDKWRNVYTKLVAAGACAVIVLDEAYTLWCHGDFRKGLARVREHIRPVVEGAKPPAVLMLTATAPPSAVVAIAHACGASDAPLVIRAPSTVRPNLAFRVVTWVDTRADGPAFPIARAPWIMRTLREGLRLAGDAQSGRAIVFVATTRDVGGVADSLRSLYRGGHATQPYEVREYAAKYDKPEKRAAQTWWGQPDAAAPIKVMVATAAFGTGLDSPDVRAVVMLGDAAPSLLEFARMAGRAGRDCRPTLCASLWISRELACRDSWKQSTVDGTGDVHVWARDAGQCGVRSVHVFPDGATAGDQAVCAAGASTACDVCRRGGSGVAAAAVAGVPESWRLACLRPCRDRRRQPRWYRQSRPVRLVRRRLRTALRAGRRF
jgi:superfamily II DNA helicase RecQ